MLEINIIIKNIFFFSYILSILCLKFNLSLLKNEMILLVFSIFHKFDCNLKNYKFTEFFLIN
jgi:hypothetical protein